jgi:filamentous hemagglutinin family protein
MSNVLNSLTRRVLVVSSALFGWRLYQQPATANPSGGTVVSGSATIKSSGTQETITTAGNAYINWNSFNIGTTETTTFVEPSATSVVWNNINGSSASQILGTINANGYVILQNQAGFYVDGIINAHGLIMTTAASPTPNLSSGGAWEFDAPPPTAKIINCGQINIAGGGSAFLIAADIENNGTISAPSGNIGLYAGEKVLVSTTPDGLGLSAEVTLPQGSVDNKGNLIADGGTIAAQAQTVNQNGLVQANTVQEVNGTIELVASDAVTLGANSTISAQGGSTGVNSGGSVTIQAGNTFSDQAGSSINISGGAQGGNGGEVEISAPQMSSIQSSINGQANAGYAEAGLSIDTDNILLNSDGSTSPSALALNINSLSSGFSEINLQAADDINLDALWNLAPGNGGGTVSLQAGDTINVPQGTGIEADSGRITLAAPSVNLNGTLQANSIGQANGVIEVDAGESLNIGADSVISANGDPTAAGGSPGGFVVLQSGNAYADTPTSTINVAGQNGGVNGIVEIIGNGPVQSTIGNTFATLINPYDLTISSSPTAGSTSSSGHNDWNFNVNDLANYSQIDLHTLDNIELSAVWILPNATTPTALTLTAGNNITFDTYAGIAAGNNWNVNVTAGTTFAPTTAQPTPTSLSDGIYLGDGAYIATQNGNINVWAANEVLIASDATAGFDGIRTLDGGNINVTAQYGDVNTGANVYGYGYTATAPYYTVSSELGGISTAAGGNVNITAGGDVISYLPSGDDTTLEADAGTGAFGPEAGNVTITAGGNVYGHYVLGNGVGIITAGGNVGDALGADPFALSLMSGSWAVNAPNGNIYLQEVRNPNGVFNGVPKTSGFPSKPNPGEHLFNYAADAAVDLNAGIGVYLTDNGIPQPDGAVQVIYPPILDISAGAGGVTLEGDITLFPSADQELTINTTDGGNLVGTAGGTGATQTLLYMSDSSQTAWVGGADESFGPSDNSATLPVQAGSSDPVFINISGSMENLNLFTTKETQITVGGNMLNCGFSGQNLNASDITSITVGGEILNPSQYAFVDTAPISGLPAADVLPGQANAWNTIFLMALNPSVMATLQVPSASIVSPSQWFSYILNQASLFGATINSSGVLGLATPNAGFVYNPTTGQIGFDAAYGQFSPALLSELTQPLTVVVFANGVPETQTIGGKTYFVTTTVNWGVSPTTLDALQTASANTVSTPGIGLTIGGPGQFNVTADSIDLGDSVGIFSCGTTYPNAITGFGDRYANLTSVTPTGDGASVDVTIAGDLTMLSSSIATLGGGDVNVTSASGSMDLGSSYLNNSTSGLCYGIYSSDGGDVNVTAFSDVNIDGSRIATFNGGNIFIESLTGDVEAGSGGNVQNSVYASYVNPVTGASDSYPEAFYGSGILAYTLVPESEDDYQYQLPPNTAPAPGNITVETPRGNIDADLAGIQQESLGGSTAVGPTINLTAGSPGYIEDIDIGNSGVIGGTVNANATGNIIGVIVSRQNSDVQAGLSFVGTVVAGLNANVNAGITVSGNIIGGTGADVSGGDGVTANVLSQNASVNGAAATSTFGSSAAATSTSQSAAQQASSQANQQVAVDSSDQGDDTDDQKKKKPALLQHIKRVTVILPKSVAEKKIDQDF